MSEERKVQTNEKLIFRLWSSEAPRTVQKEEKNAAALRITYIGEESVKDRTESEQTEIWKVKKTLAFCNEDYEGKQKGVLLREHSNCVWNFVE